MRVTRFIREVLFAVAFLILAPSLASAHGGNASRQAWDICREAEVADLCEFTDHHGDLHRGTCRSFDGAKMCVRNRPIVPASAVPVMDRGAPTSGATSRRAAMSRSPARTLAAVAVSILFVFALLLFRTPRRSNHAEIR